MNLTVKVCYNDAKDGADERPAFCRHKDFYRPGDPLRAVHTFEVEADSAEAAANIAYARMNRGSGREDPVLDAKGLRSMSVGDVVRVSTPDDSEVGWLVCESFGWRHVAPIFGREVDRVARVQ